MLVLCEKKIHIGINPMATEASRHGVLWVDADQAGVSKNLRAPVIIDKPHLIRNGLNYATWRRLKKQIDKMGIKATHLELLIEGNHFCYELDEFKEIYAKGKSKTVFQTGFA